MANLNPPSQGPIKSTKSNDLTIKKVNWPILVNSPNQFRLLLLCFSFCWNSGEQSDSSVTMKRKKGGKSSQSSKPIPLLTLRAGKKEEEPSSRSESQLQLVTTTATPFRLPDDWSVEEKRRPFRNTSSPGRIDKVSLYFSLCLSLNLFNCNCMMCNAYALHAWMACYVSINAWVVLCYWGVLAGFWVVLKFMWFWHALFRLMGCFEWWVCGNFSLQSEKFGNLWVVMVLFWINKVPR